MYPMIYLELDHDKWSFYTIPSFIIGNILLAGVDFLLFGSVCSKGLVQTFQNNFNIDLDFESVKVVKYPLAYFGMLPLPEAVLQVFLKIKKRKRLKENHSLRSESQINNRFSLEKVLFWKKRALAGNKFEMAI